MAETENAAKRTREAPRGPVKPEPAPAEAEQESEARARQLAGLLRAESAAASPPDEGNGDGHLAGLQRSSANGNGNGYRAVRPADLRALQRLAGNAAVSDLMAPPARPHVQRAALEQAPPKPIGPPPPEQEERVEPAEREAIKAEVTQVAKAWVAASPENADSQEAAGEEAVEDATGDDVERAGAGPDLAAEPGSGSTAPAAEAPAEAGAATGPEGEGQEGAEGGRSSEGSSSGPDDAQASTTTEIPAPQAGGPASAGATPSSGSDRAGIEPIGTTAVRNRVGNSASPRRTSLESRHALPSAGRATAAPSSPRQPSASPSEPTAASQTVGPSTGSAAAVTPGGAPRYPQASAPPTTPTATSATRTGAASPARPGTTSPARPGTTSPADAGPIAPTAVSATATSSEAGAHRTAEGTATSSSETMRRETPDAGPPPPAAGATAARPATETAATTAQGTSPTTSGQIIGHPRLSRVPASLSAQPDTTTAASRTGGYDADGHTASPPADRRARQAAAEDEALESETAGSGPREMAERERLDDHEDSEKGPLAQRELGQAGAAIAPDAAVAGGRATPVAPRGGGGGPRRGGGSRKGQEALGAWQAAAGGAVGGVKPADMSATEGAKGAVAEGAKTITSTRESNKPDYESEAKKVVPPTPEPPEREKMLDFTAPRGAVTSIRKVGETRLQSRTLKEAGAPPALPPYITADAFVPPEMSTELAKLEELAADATGEEKVELDKKASALRAKIQGLKDAKGVAAGGDEISIEGEAAATAEPPEAAEDRAMVAAALSELAGKQDAVVREVVKEARKKVDPSGMSDPAKSAIDAHRGSIASELTTELQGIASAAGIVDKDLDAKITAGKAKAKAEGDKAKADTETAATEGKEELKGQGKKESGEQKQAAAAVKEDAQAKVKAIEGGPEPEDIEAKVTEYLGKTITTGNRAKVAIASAVKKMTTKLDEKAKTKKRFFSRTGMTRSEAIRNYWKTELKDDEQAAYRKGEEEAVPTMAWLRTGKKGTDSEIGLIKNEVAAEHTTLDALVDSTVDLARDTIRDWGAEQEGTTRSWWEELWDDFVDWYDNVGTSADGWQEQQNAETRDTIISDAKAIDKIVTAKKEDIDKVKDEQLEGMDSERRTIIEQYLALGGSNSIQLVVALTQHDITKRRTDQAVNDVDQMIMTKWSWSDVDTICKSRNSAWPGAVDLANKILSGTGTSKVDKEKVFEGLAGAKSPLERKALEGAFAHLAPEGSEKSLDEVLEDRLSFDDEDRAQALRAGKTDEADAAAIEAALSLTSDNFAPDTESITKVLRGKSPAEIDAIKRAYKEKYGDDLDEVLGDTWFYDAEESDMVEALAKGNTDAADAAEVHDALKNLGTDEDQYNKVWENIRNEVKAQALKEGMSPAEVDYEIKRRTEAVSKAYEEKYGQPLKEAVDEDFDGTEQQLADAYLTGDADKIDATKVLDERYSFNSDDDSLEATVRNQKAKAEDYYKQYYASKQAQLRERRDAGLISEEEYRAGTQKVQKEQEDKQKQQIDAMTVENTEKLRATYGDVSGGRNLDADIYAVSQGASNDELTALLDSNGVLSEAEELHYALAGAGTDEEMVRKLLYGRKPEEIEKLKKEYEIEHGPGSFDRDIRGEMDWGRDDEQILLMLEHDTSTPEGKIAYLKAAAELERTGLLYDDDEDPVGTDKSIKILEERLRKYREIESDPNASEAQKAVAKQLLDMEMSGSESSLKEFGELKDAEIDEWVDRVKYGLATIPGFQFLLLDDALLAGPMKMILGGATEDTGQLLVEMGVSVVDIALTVVAVVSGGTAAPATVALSTLIKQGAYREVAKRIALELGKQALESMAMAAIETALSEKAWDSHDSVDVLAEQAITDFVAGLVLGGVIDVASGSLSKNIRIDADGRIVADVDGAKVDAGKVDGDATRVDSDDARTDIEDNVPDVDDAGTPKADDGSGGSGKTAVDDTGSTKVDDGGGGKKGDIDDTGSTKTGDGGGGKKGDIDDTGSTKTGDGGGGKKGGDGGKTGGDGGGGGKGEGPGKVDPEAEVAARAGMDPQTVASLKEFSDILGVRLQFRPTNAAAPGQIAGGAKAKVEVAKMKTAKAEDRLLTDALDLDGADLGKVVLFEPHHPMFRPKDDPRFKAWDELDDAGREALNKRWEQRLEEWDNLNPATNPYFQNGSGLDGGPALKMDGPFVKVQDIEGDYSHMTGDHDLFDVSWANGDPMSKADYDAIIASLRHHGVHVEHGAHITWPRDRPQDFDPAPPPKGVGPEKALANRKAWEETIDEHMSGGKEQLIEIGPEGVRETTADIIMPKWDAEGTVTPGFAQLDDIMSGGSKTARGPGGPDGGPGGPDGGPGGPDGGKTGGDSGGPDGGKTGGDTDGSGRTKVDDADGGADTTQWDEFLDELKEEVDAATTPHPAHKGEVQQIAPDHVFDAARNDTGDLSAKAQAEYAAAAAPPTTVQALSTPLDRSQANKVAGDDLTEMGSLGTREGEESFGVYHYDFDSGPGVMKVYSTSPDLAHHQRKFALEKSAALAAHETGYVRFLGEFDVGEGARGLGYDWQPGKSTEKLAEIGKDSWVKPHTIDQVQDFVNKMAERGYVTSGDFQYLVDIDGNVRPMDLEAFTPLPPPGPDRVDALRYAEGNLTKEISVLSEMMRDAKQPSSRTPGGSGAGGAGPSSAGDPAAGKHPPDPDQTQEFDPDKTQPFMQLPEERGTYDVPPSLRETQELPAVEPEAGSASTKTMPAYDPDKTQPFMQLPEERGTYDVPPSLREAEEGAAFTPEDEAVFDELARDAERQAAADTTPHPALAGEVEQIAPDNVFDAARNDAGGLSDKAQAEYAAAKDPLSAPVQTTSKPIDRTRANKVGAGTKEVGSMGAGQGSIGVYHHVFDGEPGAPGKEGVVKVFSALNAGHMEHFARELSAARAAHETGYVRCLGEFDASHATGDNLVPARAIGYEWQPGKSTDQLDRQKKAGDERAYVRIKPHTIDQVQDFVRRMAERGYVLTADFQYKIDTDGNVHPFDMEVFKPLPAPGPARDALLQNAVKRLDREIDYLERGIAESASAPGQSSHSAATGSDGGTLDTSGLDMTMPQETGAPGGPSTAPRLDAQQGSYSKNDDVPFAGPGEASVVLVGTAVDVPGPGSITAQELDHLQDVADAHGVAIAIVGDRAAGRGRNVDSGLPPGDGPGTRSRIDVIIEGQKDMEGGGQLSGSISDIGEGLAYIRPSGSFSPPAIVIRPRGG